MFRSESSKTRTTIYDGLDEVASIKHETGMVDLEITGCDHELLIFLGEAAQRLVDDGYIE
jgi:hypothetical protein